MVGIEGVRSVRGVRREVGTGEREAALPCPDPVHALTAPVGLPQPWPSGHAPLTSLGKGVPFSEGGWRGCALNTVSVPGNPVDNLSTTMTRYLWHFDADGWPLERIDTLTDKHITFFTGGSEESIQPQDGGRPMAYSIPKVSGAEWVFGGGGHQWELGGMREGAAGRIAQDVVGRSPWLTNGVDPPRTFHPLSQWFASSLPREQVATGLF